jgi:hypothetical protein
VALRIVLAPVQLDQEKVTMTAEAKDDDVVIHEVRVPAGYDKLFRVLMAALDQAASGKGKERHASDGVAFEDQPMSSINQTLSSVDGFLYQAAKKAQESRRLPSGRAQAELYGAINYLAGAAIAYDTWAADLLPQQDERVTAAEGCWWIAWYGGECPVDGDAFVNVRLRSGGRIWGATRADSLSWRHEGLYNDIVAWRLAK